MITTISKSRTIESITPFRRSSEVRDPTEAALIGASSAFSDGDRVYGEPVFVARPGGSDEDDGVLLAVGTNQRADAAALAIIDARTMALVASAEVGSSIPLGFHGSFLRAAAPAHQEDV